MPNTKRLRYLTLMLRQRLQREMLKASQEIAARPDLVVEAQDVAGIDL